MISMSHLPAPSCPSGEGALNPGDSQTECPVGLGRSAVARVSKPFREDYHQSFAPVHKPCRRFKGLTPPTARELAALLVSRGWLMLPCHLPCSSSIARGLD